MTIWTLMISHDRGTDVSVHQSADEAYKVLDDYVVEWWDYEYPDDAMPEDPNKRRVGYFDGDNIAGRESADIEAHEVAWAVPATAGTP